MCLTDELYADANKTGDGSAYTSSYDCASVTMYLQERFKMNGIINTINTACSSSANAIIYGAMLIKNGFAKRAIVGGTDSLAKYTINGFHALHILSPEKCTPFDENRKGLNLGDAELTGYCNANDAYHPSSLSDQGDGPFFSMQGALRSAKLTADQVCFINAHGTGTENNDEVESKALIRLFEKPPAFASSKANIGHTLGAAGAIEAVYSALSLVNQEIYPNLHFEKPITATRLVPVQSYQRLPLQHIMSNSFGFGGNCSSLIFSKA
jgi:3-oxoacyl-(acyl-carrier-protein) synthase